MIPLKKQKEKMQERGIKKPFVSITIRDVTYVLVDDPEFNMGTKACNICAFRGYCIKGSRAMCITFSDCYDDSENSQYHFEQLKDDGTTEPNIPYTGDLKAPEDVVELFKQ